MILIIFGIIITSLLIAELVGSVILLIEYSKENKDE